jgi:hypothetical protein
MSSWHGALTQAGLSLFTEPKQNMQAVTITDAFQRRYTDWNLNCWDYNVEQTGKMSMNNK